MPGAARPGDLVARPHAHRQGRDRRPHRRPGHRRRRLRHQAVLLQRADRAPARADPPAPGRAPRRAGGRRPAHGPGRAARVPWRDRDLAVAHRVRAAGDAHALAGQGALAPGSARARVGRPVREPLQRRRRVRALPAQQGRPALRRGVDRDRAWLRLPAAGGAGVSRLSIRGRLALTVAAALAVVLAAVGAFVYARVSVQLDKPIKSELREHIEGRTRFLHRGEALVSGGGPAGTQLLDDHGRMIERAVESPAQPLLTGAQVERTVRAGRLPAFESGGRRVEAAVVHYRGRGVIVVASSSLAQRDHALARLREQLIVGSLVGLLVATLAAYLIARRAFRPFETMRRQAAAISAAEPGGRLEVPGADDELTRLAGTLNDMLDRLERALAHERRFVAEASHELRTPLAVLRAELDLARSRPRSREELAEALDSVAEETDRLTRLADDLLLLARADEGGVRDCTPLLAHELLEMVATRFEARATALRRRIEVDAPEDLCVSGDRSALHRALTNLVDNSLRYGAGTVCMSARADGGRVMVRVADRGPGFPLDFLPAAFERFSRATGERSPDGAGLGLALVNAVAVAHGGAAYAGNVAGGGAEVWLTVPRADLPTAPQPQAATAS